MAKLRMQVEGMTCAHCEATVQSVLASAGASDPQADFRRSEATFDFEGDTSQVASAVRDSGYSPGKVETLEAQPVVGSGRAT